MTHRFPDTGPRLFGLLRRPGLLRHPLPAAAIALSALLLAGCGRKESTPAAGVPAGPAAKVYVVGTDAAYPPFESQDASGNIVGFDIDVVKAVAAQAGIQVRVVNTPWEGIFNALAQGDRDIVVSSVTITPERRATMDFTAPYFDAQQLIAVPQASRVASFADLKPLKVGVQTGTTGDEAVGKLLGKSSAAIKRFESTPLALKELEAGGVDAVVADNGVVGHYVANNAGGKFKTVSDASFVPEQYGMALKKGNQALLDALNKGLAAIKSDGSHAALYARYFGAAPGAGGPGQAGGASASASASAPAPAAPR